MRLDRWLWAARFYKTRALAARAIDGGKVEVNGERAKRARDVHAGDRVRLTKGPYRYLVTVRAVAERRGSARDAAALYDEDPATREERERRRAELKSLPTAFHEGKGRPSKKQRREIERFKRTL